MDFSLESFGSIITFLVSAAMLVPWLIILLIPAALVSAAFFSPLLYAWTKLPPRGEKVLKVLIADDDHSSLGPLMVALSSRRVHISLFENGKDVIRALKANHFDLLVLDMMMPGLSGENVLRLGERVLNNEKSTRVVFYTGYVRKASELLENKFSQFSVNAVWEKKRMSALSLHESLSEMLATG